MLVSHAHHPVAFLQLRSFIQYYDRPGVTQAGQDEPLQRGQSQACPSSSACIGRGVACPAASASTTSIPRLGEQRVIYANGASCDLACANTCTSSGNSSHLILIGHEA